MPARQVLAEKFHAVMGQAPIEYVTSRRMQLATEPIRNSSDSLATIGEAVGYESEAAFNRAFKRVTGVTRAVGAAGSGKPATRPLNFEGRCSGRHRPSR